MNDGGVTLSVSVKDSKLGVMTFSMEASKLNLLIACVPDKETTEPFVRRRVKNPHSCKKTICYRFGANRKYQISNRYLASRKARTKRRMARQYYSVREKGRLRDRRRKKSDKSGRERRSKPRRQNVLLKFYYPCLVVVGRGEQARQFQSRKGESWCLSSPSVR